MHHHLLTLAPILLATHAAAAGPAASCRDLAAKPYARLDARVHDKFYASSWENAKAWPTYLVSVQINRAPHLVRAILAECPGVTAIQQPQPIDARHFSTEVQIKVTSFAALSRILQLPAVTYVSVIDPAMRIKHPMPAPMIDFEE